jgi:hypothetical protein
MKRSWRDEYRRCERCKADYHPQRQSQSYCSPASRRAAAYGRERFAAGTTGRRRRRLEASDKAPGIPARVKRGLGRARAPKEERRLKRELKQAQIECAYAQHWVMLT